MTTVKCFNSEQRQAKELHKTGTMHFRTHFCNGDLMQAMYCLFVLGFYGPVNNEVMSSRSVKSGTFPGQPYT